MESRSLQVAFPHGEDAPAFASKALLVAAVPQPIPVELFLPEDAIGLWHHCKFAVRVLVPEAPVNKNHDVKSRQNDVGPSGQVANVQSKSKSLGMEKPSNGHFRPRIASSNPRHHATSGRAIKDVCHALDGQTDPNEPPTKNPKPHSATLLSIGYM